MKIKILGSSGFIGTHLLNSLKHSNGISLRHEKWTDEIKDANVIINLVGKAHDHKGTAKKEDYYYANFELLKLIYHQFLKSNAELLIHISSIAAVEEIESRAPLTEECEYNPISDYGFSKMEAEKWLIAQDVPIGKKIIILRPPMVHGPFDKGNLGLLFKFVNKGIPYPLSKFENNRTFIYIGNFIHYLEQIINNYHTMDSGIYHVSDNENISTNQIMEIIGEVNNKKILKIGIPKFFMNSIAKVGDYLPIPINSIRLKKLTSNLLVSNKKINKTIGLEELPFTAKEGLANTIISFKNKK